MEELDEAAIEAWLVELIAALLEVDGATLDPRLPLEDLGVASPDVVVLMIELSERLGEPVSAIVLWDHPTIADLSTFLAAVSRGEAELPDDLLDLDFG